MDRIYDIKEAAEYFKVNRETIRLWLVSKKLHGVKIGKQWRISEKDIQALFIRNENV